MAFDLLSGQQTGRDWSRGNGVRDWAAKHAVESVGKKLPWTQIGIGAAAVGLFFLLPSGKKTKTEGYYRPRRNTEPTVMIPRESMSELVHRKK